MIVVLVLSLSASGLSCLDEELASPFPFLGLAATTGYAYSTFRRDHILKDDVPAALKHRDLLASLVKSLTESMASVEKMVEEAGPGAGLQGLQPDTAAVFRVYLTEAKQLHASICRYLKRVNEKRYPEP